MVRNRRFPLMDKLWSRKKKNREVHYQGRTFVAADRLPNYQNKLKLFPQVAWFCCFFFWKIFASVRNIGERQNGKASRDPISKFFRRAPALQRPSNETSGIRGPKQKATAGENELERERKKKKNSMRWRRRRRAPFWIFMSNLRWLPLSRFGPFSSLPKAYFFRC